MYHRYVKKANVITHYFSGGGVGDWCSLQTKNFPLSCHQVVFNNNGIMLTGMPVLRRARWKHNGILNKDRAQTQQDTVFEGNRAKKNKWFWIVINTHDQIPGVVINS